MVFRLTITLEQSEYSALLKLALDEMRDPPDQLRYLLHQELVRRGLGTTEKIAAGENQADRKE